MDLRTSSHESREAHNRPPDHDLRGYLETNADIVTRITKPVSIDHIGALSAQSEQPIVFETIIEKPGYRLCDILVKHRHTQARALGVPREEYLPTLAQRLRMPPRGLKTVASGPVKEVVWTGGDADWSKLPVPFHSDQETHPYITAMNIIRDPETGFYNSCHAGTNMVGDEKGSGPHDMIRVSGQYMGLGMTWALAVLLFLGAGAWSDSKLGTTPFLMITGAFVGGAAGFYSLYYHIVIEPRERERESK